MRRFLVRGLLALVGVVAAITIFLLVQIELGNFHEVIPGELYRSAQPAAADLKAYRKQYGIQSVLNLRGGNVGDPWYNEEMATNKALGLTQLDFRMKASRELTNEQIIALIQLMKTAPKPMLIHCHSGADRTGLAAALYLTAIRNKPSAAAKGQLSLRYGHLPFWWTKAQAMDRTLLRAEPLLLAPTPAH